jgi:hypothetical protein
MYNNHRISDNLNSSTVILFQLLLWLTHLKLSGGKRREPTIGLLLPEPLIAGSMNRKERKINQHIKTNQMKAKNRIGKWLALLLMLMAGTTGVMADVGPLNKTGDMQVCLNSTESYGVMPTTDSKYTWKIISVSGGNGAITAGADPNNVISVNWTSVGQCNLEVTETNSSGCSAVINTIVITVNPLNTIALTSLAATTSQIICINTSMADITYATIGATGATITGLPAGVDGIWAANVVTISGKPTESGPFSYTVTLTGGCANITSTGTINVTPANTVALSSATGTDGQIVCINTAITDITYGTTGATGATFIDLPAGITGTWSANVATISGTPTASGPFSYTVTLTGGCANITSTGIINVTPANTVALTSVAGTDVQTACINTAITNITYATTGATGVTFSGLPVGVTGAWSGNVVTISGTPTVSGPFSYTVTLTGGCAIVTASGTITMTPENTIALTSLATTTNQKICLTTSLTDITYGTTGATGATFSGLPAGVSGAWLANVITISGIPTTITGSPFNFTVTLTGGCGIITSIGTITVNPLPTTSPIYHN